MILERDDDNLVAMCNDCSGTKIFGVDVSRDPHTAVKVEEHGQPVKVSSAWRIDTDSELVVPCFREGDCGICGRHSFIEDSERWLA